MSGVSAIRAAQAAPRSSSSIDTPSGPRMKQTRVPGRTVVGSRVNSTPLALRSAAIASMPVTVQAEMVEARGRASPAAD